MRAGRAALIFDGDCAFCTWCVSWLARRLRPDVTVVPWQRADLAAFGTTSARAQHEVLWAGQAAGAGHAASASPAGVLGGASAVAAALLACRSPVLRLAGAAISVPPLRWLAPLAYRLVARNRHRLPGGTPACAVRPASQD